MGRRVRLIAGAATTELINRVLLPRCQFLPVISDLAQCIHHSIVAHDVDDLVKFPVDLIAETVLAEFAYRPGACDRDYRVVVVRKNLSVAKGEQVLFDDIRYFFYITNRADPADQIVMRANQRCNQENLIEQLKNGVHALGMPVGDQTSNWAYMVMASLAWTLKAWFALLLPETGRWGQKYQAEKQTVLRMEFKTFLNAFMLVPCQLVRTGRRIVFRLMAWNPWLPVLFRAVDVLRQPLRC